MLSIKEPEARRHHYVPRCWLTGFTDTGDRDGKLWVTDLPRRKQWRTSPGNAGFIKDFYRLSDEQIDPVFAEKALSQIEGEIAPILRRVDQELREPGVEEFEALLYFIAIQWARVPAFRPFILNVPDTMSHKKIGEALKSPDSWNVHWKRLAYRPTPPAHSMSE
jgi:hypothetical protein